MPGRRVPLWQLAVAAAALIAPRSPCGSPWKRISSAHPAWLAAHKADFILGPVFIGLYWLRRRPGSRFGPLLIGC